jgi:hypothetical protein
MIALRMPTFITRDNGEADRPFSNFIKDNNKKKIEQAIRKSNKIFNRNVSELPTTNLKIKRRNAEKKNNCNCMLTIFLDVFTI